jgi:hypothetical protein
MKRKNISGFSILQFWAGKKDYNDILWIVDPGEKTCFKCGFLAEEIGDKETLRSFWNKSTKLEKAHIVPHSLGGTEEPRNIIFLCSRCHELCPDTIDYDLNLKWISDHRNDLVHNIGIPALSGFTKVELERLSLVHPNHIKEQMNKKTGLHGFNVSDSSIVLGLKQVFREILEQEEGEEKHERTD